MKIIDSKHKGNVVRLYLGQDGCEDYWGDDWDDAPYDCNAGTVYDEYVAGHCDIAFPFDYEVHEPCDTYGNCRFSKEDMKHQQTPCLAVSTCEEWYKDFAEIVGKKDCIKLYFGDKVTIDPLKTNAERDPVYMVGDYAIPAAWVTLTLKGEE